jgi:PAS domain S-box-containing protein
MTERSSPNRELSKRFPSWPAALIGIIVIKAILSLALTPGSFLVSYSGISYLILLVLATSFAIRNGIQKTLGTRPFWVFLAIGYGLWSLHQSIFLYYELGLHVELPNDTISDPVLFLHVAFFLSAVSTLPHRNVSDHRPSRAFSDSLLLLILLIFIYGYTVFPYQYLASTSNYALRFDILYLLENLVLVLLVGFLTLRARAPWKSIYLHLLGASVLYALSCAVANIAIDSGGYVNGKLYGLGLTASVCWFVWIPLRARQVSEAEVGATPSSRNPQASAWAMLVVVAISIPIVWELFHREEATGMRTFRLVVAIAAMVCLACIAYIKEHLAKIELISLVGLSNNRLRLAMESGRSVGWDWDIKSGRDSWFGDLKSMFGIPSDTYVGRVEDFHRRIHPLDRERIAKAVKDAMNRHLPYVAEFRVLWPDGTVRWVAAKGTFYYATNGHPERMLGMAIDITERKLAEENLSQVSRKLIEAQEKERNRIGRDLHDDIGQRLALLAVELQQVKQALPDTAVEVSSRMDELSKQTSEIAADVQALSHELHSSKLEYLGIVTAMRAFCKEFGEQQRVEIEFRTHDLPSPLPSSEISLSLFRVLQEALHNASKHSGVLHFEVQLWGKPGEIHLTVSDSGVGFDTQATKESVGIGLRSMEERLKLVNGEFSVESQPNRGTTIHARVPLSSENNRERTVE